MKKLVILGAGTAGTVMANKLATVLNKDEWNITIVDQFETHYYQPGFLFIPFNIYTCKDVQKPKRDFLPGGIDVVMSKIDRVEPDNNRVVLENNAVLSYDFLIVATGAKISYDETPGLTGELWRKNVFDFYSIEGACGLRSFFKHWEGGKLVVNVAEMPIKCPVAPLEFTFLADSFFTKKGIRDKVDIHYVTPLPGAFTKPKASAILGDMLDKKNINLTGDYNIERIDNEHKKIVSYDEKEIDFDVLVIVPTNMGDDYVERSGMGDDLNFIPTDKHTLRSKEHENIFVIGDATDLPSSKAGSVAHFQADILFENILDA
ncbi:MAG: NAD(P)/FAD-dependent oxidoreductase, partial [Candidatus Latescibacteria bacterium]|nr:NAD(P)/FAD-dependent oxidoreductase [Candidatus Latescibacterota bacterium]